LEAGAGLLPWTALAFIPLFFGTPFLYPWADAGQIAADAVLRQKTMYLNGSFFAARTAVYFAVLSALALALRHASAAGDRGDASATERLRILSGPGLCLYILFVSFAVIDWSMSLEPHWYSTMYGFLYVVAQPMSAVSLAILSVVFLSPAAPRPQHLNDMGNLLLTFTILWAYVSFMQFLIIWSGNLAEEVPWYVHRLSGGWGWVALGLVAFQFAGPFLLLLFREVKRRRRYLAGIAALLLLMRAVDQFWLVMPALFPRGFHLHWLDVAVFSALGGFWMSLFTRRLAAYPPVELSEPQPEEGEGYGV
jgi:hypothetical protein